MAAEEGMHFWQKYTGFSYRMAFVKCENFQAVILLYHLLQYDLHMARGCVWLFLPCLLGQLWVQSWAVCWTGPGRMPWGKKKQNKTVQIQSLHVLWYSKYSSNHSRKVVILLVAPLIEQDIAALSSLHHQVIKSRTLAGFLGKVGHPFIMELYRPTINHESNSGTAQQKHRLSISCPGHHSKCHCLIHSWSTLALV